MILNLNPVWFTKVCKFSSRENSEITDLAVQTAFLLSRVRVSDPSSLNEKCLKHRKPCRKTFRVMESSESGNQLSLFLSCTEIVSPGRIICQHYQQQSSCCSCCYQKTRLWFYQNKMMKVWRENHWNEPMKLVSVLYRWETSSNSTARPKMDRLKRWRNDLRFEWIAF